MTTPDPAAMPELLPCPFCGGDSFHIKYHDDNSREDEIPIGDFWAITCNKCGTFKTGKDAEYASAISAWNTRPPHSDTKGVDITGDTSDGYHTFNELYEHRHTLFAAVLRLIPDKAWKSKLHDDGTMFDGWFIAGIETPEGQVTYHIPLRLWDKFKVTELPNAPKWDGHTSDDVLQRIDHLHAQGYLRGQELDDNREPVGMDEPRKGTYLYEIKELWQAAKGKEKDFLATLYDHLNALYVEQRVYRDHRADKAIPPEVVERVVDAASCISRMNDFPDNSANIITLYAARKIAEKIIAALAPYRKAGDNV